jgi:hypothetical protein
MKLIFQQSAFSSIFPSFLIAISYPLYLRKIVHLKHEAPSSSRFVLEADKSSALRKVAICIKNTFRKESSSQSACDLCSPRQILTASMGPKTNFNLLALPTELRVQIFLYCFEDIPILHKGTEFKFPPHRNYALFEALKPYTDLYDDGFDIFYQHMNLFWKASHLYMNGYFLPFGKETMYLRTMEIDPL